MLAVLAVLAMLSKLPILARLYLVKGWHQIRQARLSPELAQTQTVDGPKVAMLPMLALLEGLEKDAQNFSGIYFGCNWLERLCCQCLC